MMKSNRLPGLVLMAAILCGGIRPASAAIRVLSPQDSQPAVAFGVGDLAKALEAAGEDVERTAQAGPAEGTSILVTLASDEAALEAFGAKGAKVGEKAESFAIVPVRKGFHPAVAVVGRDAVGAMYGAMELAEQIGFMDGKVRLGQIKAKQGSPFIALRGSNAFLHTQALDDPDSWYFDDAFWQGYIDTLARTRHNFLDLHATYDLTSSLFPNVYPYFFKIKEYPETGVSEEQARRNLDRFKKVVALAKDRGIKVGLMSYSAKWNLSEQEFKDPGDRALADYTARCVEQLMREVPDLFVIGFRIGETDRDPIFFEESYIRGLKMAGRTDVPLYTRSWVTSQPGIESIANSYPGRMFNEIKFNGEQMGLPYQATGGWMAHEGSYSYQWYSDFPSKLETIWQVRANGTHRVFPWGDPAFVARTMLACTFMNALGYSVEPMSAYYPWTDFYTNTIYQSGRYWRWMWERDWFWYALWGRLGYDPDIAEETWVRMFEQRFGKAAGRAAYGMFVESSRQVPLIYHYRNGGPDHRSIASECQTGGTLEQFLRPVPPSHMKATPLDSSCYMGVAEYADLLTTGGLTAKITPLEVARTLEEHGRRSLEAAEAAKRAGVKESGGLEFETMAKHARAINELSLYYANKIRSALDLGLRERTGSPAALASLEKHAEAYIAAWERLVALTDTTHHPFLEWLACKTQTFHWRTEGATLAEDIKFVAEYAAKARAKGLKLEKFKVSMVPLVEAPEAGPIQIRCQVEGTVPHEVDGYLRYRARGQELLLNKERLQEFPFSRFVADLGPDGVQIPNQYVATVDRKSLPARGILEYFVDIRVRNDRLTMPPNTSKFDPKHLYRVGFGDDRTPPLIEPLPAKVDRAAGKVVLAAKIKDANGIAKAVLRWKPMPSAYPWTDLELKPGADGVCIAELPITYEGLQYLYEAVDGCGNGAMTPDTRRETPYINVSGWERPPDPVYFGPQTHSQDGITVTCNHRFRFDRLVRETTTFWDREHSLDQYPTELEGLARIRYNVDELQYAPAWFEFEVARPTRLYATIKGDAPEGWRQAEGMKVKIRKGESAVWQRDLPAGKTRVETAKKTQLMFVAFAPIAGQAKD